MKDEELAKERARKFSDINFNDLSDNYGDAKEIGYQSYYCGFLAGLELGHSQGYIDRLREENKDENYKDIILW